MTYNEVRDQCFEKWMENIERIHQQVISIELKKDPDHKDIMEEISLLDKVADTLSLYKVVNNSALILYEELLAKAKKEAPITGSNERQREQAIQNYCMNYNVPWKFLRRAHCNLNIRNDMVVNLVDAVAKMRQQKEYIDTISHRIGSKELRLGIQQSILKDEGENMRYGKAPRSPQTEEVSPSGQVYTTQYPNQQYGLNTQQQQLGPAQQHTQVASMKGQICNP